jgi:hypothetical protein
MLAGEFRRLRDLINPLQAEMEQCAITMAAMDSAIAQLESRVNPGALGCVNAHSKQYGGRGGLRQFLQSEVLAAGNAGIDTVKLTLKAAQRFEFQIVTPACMERHRRNIRRTLLTLQKKGVIESIGPIRVSGKPVIWRKRADDDLFEKLLQQRDSIEGSSRG